MRTRRIEIVSKEQKNENYHVCFEYNEYYENEQFCQTLSRVWYSFPIETSNADMIEWVRVNEYKEELYKDLERTSCVYTYIEERRPPDYIRYVRADGTRWEVIGICTNLGKCYEGAVSPMPELDSPLNSNYDNSCCPMIINVLNISDNGN